MSLRFRANVLVISLACLFVVSAASGQTIWYVDAANCPGPGSGTLADPFCMIQDAINAAAANATPPDEIRVADGIYTGAGNKDLDFGGKIIKLRSANGPANCIIDCENSGRGFYFHSGETAASVVDGFTIRNGYVDSGSPSSYKGGGVYCSSSSPTLTNCVIRGNTAYDGYGGGIYCLLSSATVDHCEIFANTATYGGGVDCDASFSAKLMNCLISGNTASFSGGGVLSYHGDTSILANCLINGNTASGAIAASGGGVTCVFQSHPTLTNCTITGNSATYDGGGVWCQYSSNPTLTNCILWADAPREVGIAASTPVLTYCDVQGSYTGTGNIDLDPLFVDPDGPDNDPSTWADNNYRLSLGSPCIDAGNNAAVPPDTLDLDGDGNTTEPIPFDLDGAVRFVDNPAAPDTGSGSPPIVDMGTYEYQGTLPVGDMDCDNDVDVDDVAPFVLALIDPATYQAEHPNCHPSQADMDHSASLNGFDIQPFVDLLLAP